MQGPVSIDIGGPQPGSRTIVGQIGVEVHAPGPPTVGFLWVDGTTLNPNIYPGRTSATIYGNLQQASAAGNAHGRRLRPGGPRRHGARLDVHATKR